MQATETGHPIESPLASLHRDAGARMGVWFDCALPDDFGDWRREYSYAKSSVALIDKNYRSYFSFTGPDRVRYLNAILTNDIKDLQTGGGIASLLLSPQGRILAEIETYALENELFCISYAMIRQRLAEVLEKFIIMDNVTLADQTDLYGTLAIEGPKAAQLVQELAGINLNDFPGIGVATVSGIPCRVIKRVLDAPSAEFVVQRDRLAALWQILSAAVQKFGGGPMGYTALSALRLEQGVPWFGYDFGEKQIPHEAGLQDSHISYTKGCYTGQEIVERVRSRGQVNRRRVGLVLAGDTVPNAGDTLSFGGQEVGFITRAAMSPLLSSPIAMAYVRKEAAEPGAQLQWRSGLATVTQLPLSTAL